MCSSEAPPTSIQRSDLGKYIKILILISERLKHLLTMHIYKMVVELFCGIRSINTRLAVVYGRKSGISCFKEAMRS